MPVKHKYKCLDPDHFAKAGTSAKKDDLLFIALNNNQRCPGCGCMKVEDWGEVSDYEPLGVFRSSAASFGNPSCAKNIDATLRRVAGNFGMTNMSNAGGKAVKGHGSVAQPGEVGKYGNINIGGVEAPVNDTVTGAWGKSVYTPVRPAGDLQNGRFAGKKNVPTQVVAEHKG